MTDNALSPKSSTTRSQLDSSFTAIDWQAPWITHISQLDYLSQIVTALSQQPDNLDETAVNSKNNAGQSTTMIADLLNTAMTQKTANDRNQPRTKPTPDNQAHILKFVSQDALPEGEGYEHFIATTGNIPTRENLHDLFNGSIWLTFPKTKALLNYHHMCEISKHINEEERHKTRGRVRDTITVFDENGAIFVTTDPGIGQALIDFDWQASLVEPRNSFDNLSKPNTDTDTDISTDINTKAAVYIFGHALLEQLIQPRKPLCSHSVVIPVASNFFSLSLPERMAYIDDSLAEYMHQLLSQAQVTPRQLSPLPILGVPHFWSENANPEFYEDSRVFRSGRRKKI